MFLSKSLSISITLLVCVAGMDVRPWFTLIFFLCISLCPKSTSSTSLQQDNTAKGSDFGVARSIGVGLQTALLFFFFFFFLQDKTIMNLQLHANLSKFLFSQRVHFLVLKNNFWLLPKKKKPTTKKPQKTPKVLLNKKIADIYVDTPN